MKLTKNKAISLILSIFILFSSAEISFANTNFTVGGESTNKIQLELISKKEKVELELFSKDFRDKESIRKIDTISQYYESLEKLYSIYASQISIEEKTENLSLLRSQLSSNSKMEYKINQLVLEEIQKLKKDKKLNQKTKDELIPHLQKMFKSQKKVREAGRTLESKITNRENFLNFNDVVGLDRIARYHEKEGRLDEAIKIYSKILKLNNGEGSSLFKIAALHESINKKKPIIIDNQLYYFSSDLKQIKDISYIKISDLAIVDNFEVDWDSNTSSVIIKHKNDIIRIPVSGNQMYLNDVIVGTSGYLHVENGNSYVPLRSLFEMLEFGVNYNSNLKLTVINKSSYRKNEIDDFKIDKLVKYLLD